MSSREWDRQPGEPMEWYRRFRLFLSLGPQRTIEEAYRRWTGEAGEPDPVWIEMARNWRWADRAARFDEAGVDLAEEEFSASEVAAQARRILGMVAREIDRLLEIAGRRPLQDEEIQRLSRLASLILLLRDLSAAR